MLRWSINLFRAFRIQVAVHVSFIFLVSWVAWYGWQNGGLPGLKWSLVYVALLFTCVTLHEFGHSLTAQHFGVKVPRILLLPIGGMAEFDYMPREPRKELLITLAGPAVNFAIVLVLWPFFRGLPDLDAMEYTLGLRSIAGSLMWINLAMGCFNLLPVYPMDGGRILRSLIGFRWSYLTATKWAAHIGRPLALIASVCAVIFLGNYLMCALFLFIFWAGNREYKVVKAREERSARWAAYMQNLESAETMPNRSGQHSTYEIPPPQSP